MKKFIKDNLILILAFGLPGLLILGIALSVYLPSFFLSTKYDFLYTSCESTYYSCYDKSAADFSVVNDRLVINPIDPKVDYNQNGIADVNERQPMRIFYHDTETNVSREISLREAQSYRLSNLITSPDGVTVSDHRDYNGDFFFFFGGGSDYGYYLTKGKSKKKLNLINDAGGYYYNRNFTFIGWVN